MYDKHGKEFNFVGVIITNENVYLRTRAFFELDRR